MTIETNLTLDAYRKYDLITDEDLNAVQGRFDEFDLEDYQSWFDIQTDEEILNTVIDHQEEFGKINLYDENNAPSISRFAFHGK